MTTTIDLTPLLMFVALLNNFLPFQLMITDSSQTYHNFDSVRAENAVTSPDGRHQLIYKLSVGGAQDRLAENVERSPIHLMTSRRRRKVADYGTAGGHGGGGPVVVALLG